MVAGIDRDVQNLESLTDAEIEKLKSRTPPRSRSWKPYRSA